VRQLARRTATGDALHAGNPAYPETPLAGEIQVLSKVEEVLRKLPVYRPSAQKETGNGLDDQSGPPSMKPRWMACVGISTADRRCGW